MLKYHINKINGTVGVCHAQENNCPFVEKDYYLEHYTTPKEARNAYEEMMKNNTLPISTTKEKLKEMNPNDLAHTLLNYCEENNFNREKINTALEIASILHAGQKRLNRGEKQITDYIEHPLRVTLRLARFGVKNEKIMLAGLLHDTVEDCSKNFAKRLKGEEITDENKARDIYISYIEKKYGKEVKRIILSVTNDHVEDRLKKTMTSKQKREKYYNHLKKNITNNPLGLLIKTSDYIDNAGSLQYNDLPGREEKINKMAKKYYPCLKLFRKELNKNHKEIPAETKRNLLERIDRIEGQLSSILLKYSHLED